MKENENIPLKVLENQRPYKCDECGKRYKTSTHLKRHKKTHDPSYLEQLEKREKSFICSYEKCKKAFYTQHHLNRHLKQHEKEGDFECQTCLLKFTKKSALRLHIRKEHPLQMEESLPQHVKQIEHKCPHCNKIFAVYSKLQKHIHRHKQETFICVHCNKTFGFLSELKKHMRICANDVMKDGEYICQFCKKSFKNKNSLNHHITHIHTKPATFECPFPNCPSIFTRKSNLKAHIINVHFKLHQWKCPTCNTNFQRKHVLARHLKTIHKLPQDDIDNIVYTQSQNQPDTNYTDEQIQKMIETESINV